MYKGKSHAEGGIPVVVDGNTNVEIEGNEYHLCRDAMSSAKIYSFKNKSNKEILDSIYSSEGCKFVQGIANSGDFIVCKLVVLDDDKRTISGTVKSIIDTMQSEKSCNVSEGSNKMEKGGYVSISQFNYRTLPDHALEYGIKAKNPLYLKNFHVTKSERLKGIGKKMLKYLDDYAIENGNDVIFGHINQKATFSKNNKETYFNDTQLIKNWLQDNGYAVNDDDNNFHKVIGAKMKQGGEVITYRNKFNKKYGFELNESHSLEEIAKLTNLKLSALQDIYNKGIGAYKTNPESVRPIVKSKEQWAMARVYSAVMGGKASKVDANELERGKFEDGGEIDNLFELTIYNVIAGGNNDLDTLYFGTNFNEAEKRYEYADSDDLSDSDKINGGLVEFQKKIDTYKFVYELDKEYNEEISDYPIEEYYEDRKYYKLIDEKEFETIKEKQIIGSKEIELENKNKGIDLLDEVVSVFKKKYPRYVNAGYITKNSHYFLIPIKDTDKTIELRISDHSPNLRNIDSNANEILFTELVKIGEEPKKVDRTNEDNYDVKTLNENYVEYQQIRPKNRVALINCVIYYGKDETYKKFDKETEYNLITEYFDLDNYDYDTNEVVEKIDELIEEEIYQFENNKNEVNVFAKGGNIPNSNKECLSYIETNKKNILANGYCHYFRSLPILEDVYAHNVNEPEYLNDLKFLLITYNNTNSISLKKEIKNLLGCSEGLAKMIVYKHLKNAKKVDESTFETYNDERIIIANRDEIVCQNVVDEMEKGGSIDEHKETYEKWKSLVNMSKSELKEFYDSQEGKDAGLSDKESNDLGISNGRESARWIMRMKDTPVSDWTPKMWEWANKQISFISRMSGNKGSLYDDNGNKTRKHTSLLIWGHNPEKMESKMKDGGEIKKENKAQDVASEYGWTATPTDKGGYEFTNRNGKMVAIMKVEKGRNVFYDIEGKNKLGSDTNLERGIDDLIGKYFYGKKEKEVKKVEPIETIEPNSSDEFDEIIMANIDPHDDWIGNLVKERDVKQQIYKQLSGDEQEKKAETNKIFYLYAEKNKTNRELHEMNNKNFEEIERLKKEIANGERLMSNINFSGDVTNEINRWKKQLAELEGKENSDYQKELNRQVSEGEIEDDSQGISLYHLAKNIEETTNNQFKGIHHNYKNQYVLNKAIEELLMTKDNNYSSEEKVFIRKYSGYGGLDKYGKGGKGSFFEYYTPTEIIERMWGLAYKYGYDNGSVLETSVGRGEFFRYAPKDARLVGYEISEYSGKICKILYPTAEINIQPFEKTFIKNNYTIKGRLDDLEKFSLVIGNPPYGDFSKVQSRYMSGMGEKDYTQARNYVEYFIRRGMDLLESKGLLVFIIGASLQNGGKMFLDSDMSPVKTWLSENCTLETAYRLPDSVFERTGVTADIIVLKKN